MQNNFFIYTEIVNCGKIGKIAIDSFHKYNDHKIHIYGTKADFEWINKNDNNIFIEVDEKILEGYKKGHIGTALLWEKVIKECSEKYMIHFDSDVIFRANIIDEMLENAKEYDLIGPIRNYHSNPHKMKGVMDLTDVCQTNCTLWNRELISKKYLQSGHSDFNVNLDHIKSLSFRQAGRELKWFIKNLLLGKNLLSIFARMIHGTYNPLGFQTIDFFDPVMFDMISNGAKIYHLDFDEVGGSNEHGSRDNIFKNINNFPTPYKLDFGSKIVHFSCVGSGMNFYNNRSVTRTVGKHYVKCALDRYALFCKIFYDEELSDIDVDLNKYEAIIDIKNWY